MTEAPGESEEAPRTRALLSDTIARLSSRAGEAQPGDGSYSVEDVQTTLEALGQWLEEIVEGSDPEPIRELAANNRIVPPLLRSLARELLSESTADPRRAVATLTALRAVAALRGDPLSTMATGPDEAEDLEAAMRGTDAFELLVEVVHDFRSPLTSILFLAEALRDGHSGPVNDIQKSQLGLMYGAAFELTSIASDVMDLARRKRDLTDDEAESFSLPEVFATVERMVQPMVEEKGLALKVVVPERTLTRGHAHALSRVLLNLTTNALKFTEDGTVEIGVRPVPHGLMEYYVRDTGRGIPPEQKEKLFRPFLRRPGGATEGHHFSGSGVGLSIARRLLRRMGSDLTLDYSDERGTQFSFLLPASPRG